MGILSELNPNRVFYYFEEICNIPHGSYNTKSISDYCVKIAKELGLEVVQDQLNNVIIRKPASKGCEQAPVMMLQGHLDMVCEKEPDCAHDFMTEGLKLQIIDGYVKAIGTTLGGDDGIAIAIALAILEDNTLIHPPLEVVFTTEEEVGMDGAIGLDTSGLNAKYLLNLDSEDEGVLTVSCAGGATIEHHLPYEADNGYDYEKAYHDGLIYELKVTGLIGGHSGVEIHKGRANSNKLMAVLLQNIMRTLKDTVHLASVDGGLKHNAIPRETTAILALDKEADVRLIIDCIERYQRLFTDSYGDADPGITIEFKPCGLKYMIKNGHVMTASCARKLLQLMYSIPDGVHAMSREIRGLPETSSNFGILRTEKDEIYVEVSNRSSNPASLELSIQQMENIAFLCGFATVRQSEYPGWSYRKNSKLRDTMVQLYKDMFGVEAKVEAIHAGLECGIILSKMPDLDIVSTGPDILDIHTPQERMNIASVERTYRYVLAVLETFSKQKG